MRYFITATYAADLGDEPQVYETELEAADAGDAERRAQEECRKVNGMGDAKPGDAWYQPLLDVAVRPIHPPKVEILHVRDPDSACETAVWVDGVEVEFTEDDIDPGAGGWTRAEWEDRIADTRAQPNLSDAFRAAVVRALESMSDNEFIEED